jgi:hypothetical protein
MEEAPGLNIKHFKRDIAIGDEETVKMKSQKKTRETNEQ